MFCISKNVLNIRAVTFLSALSWGGHLAESRLLCIQSFLYIVNSRTHFLQILSLHHYALAYLLFTVSLIFCTSPILVLSSSSIFAQLLYFFHIK